MSVIQNIELYDVYNTKIIKTSPTPSKHSQNLKPKVLDRGRYLWEFIYEFVFPCLRLFFRSFKSTLGLFCGADPDPNQLPGLS